MDAEELSQHVDELELRLERLRVLYDQYFMGIEKVPPAVPQKDVDRRIWVLRREKIRNTGVRFKFQTIIQRYSTFHSYWMRIMREIENGTYKRHVQRAKRRFGEDPTPKVDAAREAPPSIELDDANTFDVDLDLMDDDASLPATGDDLGISTAPPPPPGSRPPAILSPLGTMRGPAPLPTAPAPASGAPTTGAPATAAPPARPPLPARAAAVAPSLAAPTTAVAAARPAPPPSKPAPLPASPPPSPSNKGVTTTAPVVASAVSSTAVTQPRAATTEPKPRAPTASVPKILAAKVHNDDDLDAMLNEALGGPAGAGASRPEPRLPSTTTQGVGPSRPSDARASTGAAGSTGSSAGAAPIAPKPAAPVPASRPAARPATAPVVPAPASVVGGGDFRQVYAKYVEARRNNGESTAGLTYESLAKNLRDTTEKLKTKSGGKPIDFDVVVKDGKTILKPVVK